MYEQITLNKLSYTVKKIKCRRHYSTCPTWILALTHCFWRTARYQEDWVWSRWLLEECVLCGVYYHLSSVEWLTDPAIKQQHYGTYLLPQEQYTPSYSSHNHYETPEPHSRHNIFIQYDWLCYYWIGQIFGNGFFGPRGSNPLSSHGGQVQQLKVETTWNSPSL